MFARHRLAHAHHAHAERVGENEVIQLLLDGRRRGVDDASAAALLHVGQRRADGGGVAVQAFLIAVRPVGLGQRLEGAGLRAGAMIDKAVDAAEVLRDLVDHRGDALVVEHVVHIRILSYCRKDAEEERFYEIFFQLCRKYSVRWASATPKEKSFIEEVTRVTYERDRAQRLGLPLSEVRPSFAS